MKQFLNEFYTDLKAPVHQQIAQLKLSLTKPKESPKVKHYKYWLRMNNDIQQPEPEQNKILIVDIVKPKPKPRDIPRINKFIHKKKFKNTLLQIVKPIEIIIVEPEPQPPPEPIEIIIVEPEPQPQPEPIEIIIVEPPPEPQPEPEKKVNINNKYTIEQFKKLKRSKQIRFSRKVYKIFEYIRTKETTEEDIKNHYIKLLKEYPNLFKITRTDSLKEYMDMYAENFENEELQEEYNKKQKQKEFEESERIYQEKYKKIEKQPIKLKATDKKLLNKQKKGYIEYITKYKNNIIESNKKLLKKQMKGETEKEYNGYRECIKDSIERDTKHINEWEDIVKKIDENLNSNLEIHLIV